MRAVESCANANNLIGHSIYNSLINDVESKTIRRMIGIKPRLCSEYTEVSRKVLSRDFQTDSAVVRAESIDDR